MHFITANNTFKILISLIYKILHFNGNYPISYKNELCTYNDDFCNRAKFN